MNQRHFWTVVVFTTVLGIPSVGRAETTKEKTPTSPSTPSDEVMKVGEYQSPTEKLASDAVITEIHTSSLAGHQAATLYIRNIPVLTFVGQQAVANQDDQNSTKLATMETSVSINNQTNKGSDDPVQRATLVAARINQMILDKVDASKITVSWKAGGESTSVNGNQKKSSLSKQSGDRYIIKVNSEELVAMDGNTRLPDTTNNLAKDALQVANRLRKLLGNASPLSDIANVPSKLSMPIHLPKKIAIGPMVITFNGTASWYGYDGSGNETAAGERYNPEGMTAAHRSLPLGTKVRVTNTHNGRSVVVRINDRGPYIRGRIIDLSAAAARILGMMSSGVAQVRIEVLGR